MDKANPNNNGDSRDSEHFESHTAREFERLWDTLEGQIRRIALSRTGSADISDEVCAEVATRFWAHRNTLRDMASVSAWAIRITHREIARYYSRRASRREAGLDEISELPDTDETSTPPLAFVEPLIEAVQNAGFFGKGEAEAVRNGCRAEIEIVKSGSSKMVYWRGLASIAAYLLYHPPEAVGGRNAVRNTCRAAVREGRLPAPDVEVLLGFVEHRLAPRVPTGAIKRTALLAIRFLRIDVARIEAQFGREDFFN